MIRRATLDDLPEVLRIGLEFHAYSPWSMLSADPEALSEFLAKVIEHGAVFLSDEGMVGGVLNPAYFNPAHIMAAELFWYAKSGGTELRQALEAWAAESGCCGITFSGLVDKHEPAMRRVFARAGYAPIETAYFKRIP